MKLRQPGPCVLAKRKEKKRKESEEARRGEARRGTTYLYLGTSTVGRPGGRCSWRLGILGEELDIQNMHTYS